MEKYNAFGMFRFVDYLIYHGGFPSMCFFPPVILVDWIFQLSAFVMLSDVLMREKLGSDFRSILVALSTVSTCCYNLWCR